MEKLKKLIIKIVKGYPNKYYSLDDINELIRIYNDLVNNTKTTTINSNIKKTLQQCDLLVNECSFGYLISLN